MSGIMPAIKQSNNLLFASYSSVNGNTNLLPPEGGSFIFDPTMDSIEQGKAVLKHYESILQYEKVGMSKDMVWKQFNMPIDALLQSSMPKGMNDEEQCQWILNHTNSAKRESKLSIDKYYNSVGSLSKDVIEDGRSHISGIYSLINNINSNYQKNFGEITKEATKFMEILNTELGKISSYTKAGSDGKINFKPADFLRKIDSAIFEYTGKQYSNSNDYFHGWQPDLNNAKPLKTIIGGDSEFEFWKKKLDGQGFIVRKNGNEIKIFPDFKPITEIYNTVANTTISWDGGDMLTQSFQSMQTGIDSQKNAVNNSISRLLETFRQDNSHFETLTQLLIQLLKDLFQYNAGFANT